MQIDIALQYKYTSSAIRPFQVQEYFPLKIEISKEVLNNPLIMPPPRRLLAAQI